VSSLRAPEKSGLFSSPSSKKPFKLRKLKAVRAMKTADFLANLDEDDDELDVNMDEHKSVKLGVKFVALVAALRDMRRKDASAKALIFTQFTETMSDLERKLPVKTVTITGDMSMHARRAACERFQKDPSIVAFLLSMRAGAVGLTLTAASNVILMEPCLNIAQTKQAINRVYRIGQTKQVVISHIVVKGTLEERILARNMALLQQAWKQEEEQKNAAAAAGAANGSGNQTPAAAAAAAATDSSSSSGGGKSQSMKAADLVKLLSPQLARDCRL
jgi:SNF2 family DNA or RNA helicase